MSQETSSAATASATTSVAAASAAPPPEGGDTGVSSPPHMLHRLSPGALAKVQAGHTNWPAPAQKAMRVSFFLVSLAGAR